MKTSIFDMNFVLPPMMEMHEVVRESLASLQSWSCVLYCTEGFCNNC